MYYTFYFTCSFASGNRLILSTLFYGNLYYVTKQSRKSLIICRSHSMIYSTCFNRKHLPLTPFTALSAFLSGCRWARLSLLCVSRGTRSSASLSWLELRNHRSQMKQQAVSWGKFRVHGYTVVVLQLNANSATE